MYMTCNEQSGAGTSAARRRMAGIRAHQLAGSTFRHRFFVKRSYCPGFKRHLQFSWTNRKPISRFRKATPDNRTANSGSHDFAIHSRVSPWKTPTSGFSDICGIEYFNINRKWRVLWHPGAKIVAMLPHITSRRYSMVSTLEGCWSPQRPVTTVFPTKRSKILPFP